MDNISNNFIISTPQCYTANNSDKKSSSNTADLSQQQKETDLNNNPLSAYNRILCKRVDKSSTDEVKTAYKKNLNCLLGGALGDALGRPVERLRTDQMLEYYGKEGIRDLATVGLKARVTDDTQMTMFTADGLIRSALKNGKNKKPDYDLIYKSYENWYKTQTKDFDENDVNGWLSTVGELYSPAGPGKTCLGSLKAGIKGSVEEPINESAGCGGVMRVSPAGLMYDDPKVAFEVGAECAALTHGGKEAYLPSGFFAAVISEIRQGKDLETAFKDSLEILKTYEGHEQTSEKIEKAMELAKSDVPSNVAIESLGYGFSGDEAMAISTYCIFKEPDNLKDALILAVNHSGDSDSTGAITGNVLGLYLGLDSIPQEWLDSLELTSEISQLAKDMADVDNISDAQLKYPH